MGEMVSYLPIDGAYVEYASRFVDNSFGFALGWLVFYNYSVTVAAEATAVAGMISKFPAKLGPDGDAFKSPGTRESTQGEPTAIDFHQAIQSISVRIWSSFADSILSRLLEHGNKQCCVVFNLPGLHCHFRKSSPMKLLQID
jgi:amino acid transporter